MYHRRFEYMRYAKGQPAGGLSLGASGAAPRDLTELQAGLDLRDADAPRKLKEAIASRYGVDASQVVLFVGTSEANAVIASAFVRAGDEVLVERPAYEALPGLVEWLGARVRRVERSADRDWALDLDALEAAIGPATKLVMVTHPHNPSGRPFDAAELDRLRAISTARDVPILVDEVYRDDLPDPPPIAAAGESNLITTSSLTKVYGLGALRVGWAILRRDWAARVDELVDWFHVVPPLPSVAFALSAWPHLDAWLAEQRRAIEASRAALEQWRARVPLLQGPVFEGMPFYCARLWRGDDREVCAQLQRSGLALPAGSWFEAAGFARVGFGRLAPRELERALAIVEDIAHRIGPV